MKTIRSLANKAVVLAAEARKALVAAASVAVTVQAFSGTPTDLKAVAADVLAVLGTFGVVYQTTNK